MSVSERQRRIDEKMNEKFGPKALDAVELVKHHGHQLAVFILGPTDIVRMPFPDGTVGIECVTCRRVIDGIDGGYYPCQLARMAKP